MVYASKPKHRKTQSNKDLNLSIFTKKNILLDHIIQVSDAFQLTHLDMYLVTGIIINLIGC